ncbi:hypothetical protein NDU88_004850 [Pleurodeles waltl]|uniref:Uncharacterized protein n=1 Tax=Pleurodeles waltl TaxID=8319 RepID=A0AAV7NPP6_PLEWA|nr:hypothetical protein NDU88_004850 [Pleurodeles waltl]
MRVKEPFSKLRVERRTRATITSRQTAVNDQKLNIEELRKWVQRAVFLLGNANAALCIEMRKSSLMKIDRKLGELADKEAGGEAKCLLFGEEFVK